MPAGAAEDFVAKCRQLKLDFVLFVRHASSAPLHAGAAKRAEQPHDWKIDDQMRVLTQKGKDQCAAAAWFRELDVRAALTSPARRASETAMRMTDRTETEEQKVGSIYLRMVAGVHPAGMSEPCEALFETMGYGPLRVFFEAAGGEDLCGNQPVSRVQVISRRRRDRAGSVELRGTGIATPSSRRRVDGVEDDAMIQQERAVKF
jgi:hypothetical protein